ncbi:sporulation integral membrane protein YtvI [Caldicellulosiruptoraceae bacterium PP1]
MKKYFENKFIKVVLFIILFAIFVYSISYLSIAGHQFFKWIIKGFIPVILGLLIAMVFEPIVLFLDKRKIKRGISAILLIVLLNVVVVFLLLEGIFILVDECSKIISALQNIDYANLYDYFNNLFKGFKTVYTDLPTPIINIIQSLVSELTNALNQIATIGLNIIKVIPATLKGITIWFFSCISAFFFIRDRFKISRWFIENFNAQIYKETSEIIFKILNSVIDYAKSQIILSIMMFLSGFIGLSLIKAPYTLIISLLLGILSIIPIIGSGIILLPWIVFSFVVGNNVFAVKLLIVYLVVLALREFVSIKIVAVNVGISTFTTLISIYAGVEIFGTWGFIIGPLFVVFLKAILESGIIIEFRKKLFSSKE